MLFVLLYILFCITFIPNEKNILVNIELNADIKPVYEKIEGRDWNGDGYIYREFNLENDELFNNIVRQIESNPHWHRGKLDENIYGKIYEEGKTEDIEGNDCYYFFKDRYRYYGRVKIKDVYDYNEYDKNEDLRYSINYTAAVLDIESRMLYMYIIDT